MQKIVPHLWYDGAAEEAARRYADLVPGSAVGAIVRYPDVGQEVHGREPGSVMFLEARLGDTTLVLLNGGPLFRFTPAVSLFVTLDDAAALDRLWDGLSEGGTVMMPLDRYDWSERYGWVADRWGLNWQVMLGRGAVRTVVPELMFAGDKAGKAEEALAFYAALFAGGSVDGIVRHEAGAAGQKPGSLAHGEVRFGDDAIKAMDNAGADFAFNEALSILVECDDQAEVDRLWSALSAVPEAEACGWLKDRYGVSWQITPRALEAMMTSGDPAAVRRLTASFMRMKKLDLATLERAFAGEVVD